MMPIKEDPQRMTMNVFILNSFVIPFCKRGEKDSKISVNCINRSYARKTGFGLLNKRDNSMMSKKNKTGISNLILLDCLIKTKGIMIKTTFTISDRNGILKPRFLSSINNAHNSGNHPMSCLI